MRNPRSRWIAAAASWVWIAAGLTAAAQGAEAAGSFKASLDGAIRQLGSYDFGGNAASLTPLANLAASTYGKPQERQELEAALVGVLRSSAARGAKDFACRQLAIVGTAAAVPTLGELLTDENLSHMARFALERIPGPEADAALCQALGKLASKPEAPAGSKPEAPAKVQNKLLIGVLNSLGSRRAGSAVAAVSKLLDHADPAVVAAAAVALGKIGAPAADSLLQALGRATSAARPALADGCLLCADALAAQGKADAAVAIYDRVRGADVPRPARIAATRGSILARGPAGSALLLEQIRGADASLFGLALSLTRELPGEPVTQVLAAELGKLPVEKQAALITALADRADRAASPAVVAIAEKGDAVVRPVALRALVKLGGEAAVPLLFQTAVGAQAEIAQAARGALESLPGKEVDQAVAVHALNPDLKIRVLAIETLGRRHVAGATPLLLKQAVEADATVRAAAVRALGETAGPQDLDALVVILVQAKPGESAAAEAALAALIGRTADKEMAAAKFAAALAQAGAEPKSALLRQLGLAGSPNALAAVRATLQDGNEAVRDTALRVLAGWPDVAAAEPLLALAKTSDSRKYQVLALQGYIRLAGQTAVAADKRLAMCKEAMGLASRDEEKKLVLGALGRIATLEALTAVVPFVDNAAMKDEAAAAAVAIGQQIAASHPAPVAAAMNKVLQGGSSESLKKQARELLARVEKK